jgi:hypothetical protein
MKRYLFLLFFCLPFISKGQTITTWAGTGSSVDGGDGQQASLAGINRPYGAIFDKKGNFYTVSPNTHRVRKISADGIISTIAGNGAAGFSGDGGLAVNAQVNSPRCVYVDQYENVYIADGYNRRIRKIDTNGIINTIAGNGITAFSGDGGPATSASIVMPTGLYVDSIGCVYSCEGPWIRKIDTNGIINTIMGTGIVGFSGDGGLASLAQMNAYRMYMDKNGNITIVDQYRIRRVDGATNIITTIAGTGLSLYNGDEIPAISANMNDVGLAWDAQGNMYIADLGNNRVRMVDAAGIIHTVAGIGTTGYSGDGGLATLAEMFDPTGVDFDSCGNLYIPVKENHNIRKVSFNPNCFPLNINEKSPFTFTLSPNPTTSQITITSSIQLKKLHLINAVGVTVWRAENESDKVTVDVSELPTGIYFLTVYDTQGNKRTEKVVKQ